MKKLFLIMTIASVIASCGGQENPTSSAPESTDEAYPKLDETTLNGLVLESGAPDALPTEGNRPNGVVASPAATTYASGVIPWYDRNHGDQDWMVVFYLPTQPRIIRFQGLLWMGVWVDYSGYVQLYDARWTSYGFRVMILMGNWIAVNCGTSPNRFRLVY